MAIKTFDTTAVVHKDGTVTLQLPSDVTAGPHRIIALVEETPTDEAQSHQKEKEFVFPVIEEAEWPDDMPLCREDLYGEDGR